MQSQSEEEKFSHEELQYIRIALILALGNPDTKDMVRTEAALKELFSKLDCMYHHYDESEEEKRTLI